MSSFRHLFAIIILLLTGLGVFSLKHHVTELQEEISELQNQITIEKDSMLILSAEWAYLNKPERLCHLAEKYLDMQLLGTSQIYKQKNNIQLTRTNTLPERPIIISNRTKISDSLLSKVNFTSKQKIKWDEKRNKFIRVKSQDKIES